MNPKRTPESYKLMGQKILQKNKETFETRFWEKVKKRGADDCWNWIGRIGNHGYGILRHERLLLSHRVAWELTNGTIERGLFVLHRCDNRVCCNPKHLFLGTHLDNIKVMARKGRCWKTKLTERQAIEIIAKYKSGIWMAKLAREYSVNPATIRDLVTGGTWQHLAR